MAEKWNIIRFRCHTCNGTGAFPSELAGICPNCAGTGYSDSRMEIEVTDIIHKLNNLKDKVDDIWDKVK